MLLGLAALLVAAFLYLYFVRRVRDEAAEMISSLVIGSYGFFVVVRFTGGVINEHFFYFLMPGVALAIAYAVVAGPRLVASAGGLLPFGRRKPQEGTVIPDAPGQSRCSSG